jgi:hypothetical protein
MNESGSCLTSINRFTANLKALNWDGRRPGGPDIWPAAEMIMPPVTHTAQTFRERLEQSLCRLKTDQFSYCLY